MPTKKILNRRQLLFIAIFTITLLFNIFKAHMGYAYNDETFFISLPHRIYMGDALFRDEWFVAQLMALPYYPVIWIFELFNHSFYNDGIVLFTRLAYVLIWTLTCLFVWHRLNCLYGRRMINAMIYVYLVTYAPLGEMQLSYNVLSLIGVLIGLMIILSYKVKPIELYFCGMALALAAYSTPYYAIVLVLVFIGILIIQIPSFSKYGCIRHFLDRYSALNYKNFKWIVAGVSTAVFLFIIYLINNVSLEELVNAIHIIINDPSHVSGSFGRRIFMMAYSLIGQFKILGFIGLPFFVYSIFSKKKRRQFIIIQMILVAITMVYIALNLNKPGFLYNIYVVPICYLGLVLLPFCKQKNIDWYMVFVYTALFVIGLYFSSNTLAASMSTAITVCSVASFYIIGEVIEQYFSNNSNERRYAYLSSFGICFVLMFGIRFYQTYNDSNIFALDNKVSSGPLSGLYVDDEKYSFYNSVYNDFMQYENYFTSDKRLLALSKHEWIYFVGNMEYATYSTWSYLDDPLHISRLNSYYYDYNHEIPDIIYGLKADFDEAGLMNLMEELKFNDNIASIDESDIGWFITLN